MAGNAATTMSISIAMPCTGQRNTKKIKQGAVNASASLDSRDHCLLIRRTTGTKGTPATNPLKNKSRAAIAGADE
jgi:hypothetical protein